MRLPARAHGSFRVRDRDQCRPEQALTQHVTATHDLDTGRLGDVRAAHVGYRLVQGWVERVALLTERGQPELRQCRIELIRDSRERADEIAVVAGTVEIVEYGQERRQHRSG